MKKYIFLLAFPFFFSCDSDKGLNCFQSAGDIIETQFEVEDFTSIVVEERLQLIVKQGPVQRVVVKTGSNLLNDIDVQVVNGELLLINNNGCNLVRDYDIDKVYVTAPNLVQIRNASGYVVASDGVLAYPSLTLLSEDLEEEDNYHKDGDFNMQLQVGSLKIIANGLSNFFLSGKVENADIQLLEGDMRFEGRDLAIQNLTIFHRGTQQVIVNPIMSLRGKVLSTGNLISINRPPIVEIEETYKGRLIFENQ